MFALYLANIYDATEVQKHVSGSDTWATTCLQRNTGGYGPYNVTSLQSGQQAVFTANANYWNGTPKIKSVIYRDVPAPSNRLSLLEAGAVALAKDLTPAEFKQVPTQASYRGGFMVYVHINVKDKPYDDLNVRKALAFATPYKGILESVYLGSATQLRGPVIDTFPDFFGDEFFHYTDDPATAKSYLRKANLPNGFNVQLAVNSAQPNVEQIAIQLKGAWDALGMNTTITAMDPITFGARKQAKQLSIFVDTNLAHVPDVGYTALLWFQPQSILNYGNYNNPSVTKLTNESISTLNPGRRTEIARQLQKILINDLPFLYLAQPGYHIGITKPVTSVSWVPNTPVTFNDITTA